VRSGREPIETAEIAAKLKAPPDGAVVVFEGIVRNHSGNRATLYLEYEAYEAMAIAKMREIGAQMREKFSIRRFAMIHRLGRLEIAKPRYSSRSAQRIAPPHSTPAASALTRSRAPCRSGRRSFSATARHGPKEKFLPHKQSFSPWQESSLIANDSSIQLPRGLA